MTDEQVIHLYQRFLGQDPTADEVAAISKRCNQDGDSFFFIDPRALAGESRKPTIAVYTSCHANQLRDYLNAWRPDITETHHVHYILTHQLQLDYKEDHARILHGIFADADYIFCNWLAIDKFGWFATENLIGAKKATVRLVTFVPPCFSAFWPVAEFFGEDPVHKYLDKGYSVDEIIEIYKNGQFDPLFNQRFSSQIEGLRLRERERDVKLSDFILRNYKTHKIFFTTNHPSFHVIGYFAEALLHKAGFEARSEFHSLALPVNGGHMGNHWPETDYEFTHYRFTYPKTLQGERGGAEVYYPQVIREIAERRLKRANQPPVVRPEDDM